MSDLHRDFVAWIDRQHQAQLIGCVWSKLLELIPGIPVPQAGVFENDVQFNWDADEHHFELDLRENEADWFYMNRRTREILGGDLRL